MSEQSRQLLAEFFITLAARCVHVHTYLCVSVCMCVFVCVSSVIVRVCMRVCMCACMRACRHLKWRVEDHVLAEEDKESGRFVRSLLVASAGRVLRRLMEPQRAFRGFSPVRSAAPRTVMDHRAPATRAGVFALSTTYHCTLWTWLG